MPDSLPFLAKARQFRILQPPATAKTESNMPTVTCACRLRPKKQARCHQLNRAVRVGAGAVKKGKRTCSPGFDSEMADLEKWIAELATCIMPRFLQAQRTKKSKDKKITFVFYKAAATDSENTMADWLYLARAAAFGSPKANRPPPEALLRCEKRTFQRGARPGV